MRTQVEVLVTSAAVRTELHRIIQRELGMGIFKPETKRYVLEQSKSSENEARRESF
jgi:aspartate/glutamate racemase